MVTGVTSGRDALGLAETEIFDMAVVDLRMPEVDGLEVLRRLRELQPFLKAIVLTGLTPWKEYARLDGMEDRHESSDGTPPRVRGDEGRDLRPGEEEDIEEELRRRTRLLTERVKELNCLYSLSKLADSRDMQLGDFLQQTVIVIPEAWQYPEITCARIVLNEAQHVTGNFVETEWKQEAPIIMHGAPAGGLEVFYLEVRPQYDEGPFLQEERNLINIIAQRLGEIAERKWAEQRLLAYQERLRSLAEDLVLTEERERRRIACHLHDQIGQVLATVKIRLSLLLNSDPSAFSARGLLDIQSLVDQAITDTRSLVFDLSPPVLYEFGLKAALEWLVEHALSQYGLQVELREQGQHRPVSEEIRVMLFRATRELIANVSRHASASIVRIFVVWSANEVCIRVEDDGIGFDVARARRKGAQDGSFGLFSIHERLGQLGGRVDIDSRPDRGTRAALTVPLGPKIR